jgi:hypothetical protein
VSEDQRVDRSGGDGGGASSPSSRATPAARRNRARPTRS